MRNVTRMLLLASQLAAWGLPATQQYEVIDTGMRLGIGSGDSFAVNGAGDIAGTSNAAADGWHHGFVFSDGALTDLGTLGGIQSFANALNNLGQVVGQADTGIASCMGEPPVLWEYGMAVDLGTFGGPLGTANGINDSGQIVGSSWMTCSGPVRGFHCRLGSAGPRKSGLSPAPAEVIATDL